MVSEKSDMAPQMGEYQGYSPGTILVRMILTTIFLIAGIVFVIIAYGFITDSTYFAFIPSSYTAHHYIRSRSFIEILNPYSFVQGAVLGCLGVLSLLYLVFLWGDDAVFYGKYLEAKRYLEDPPGAGIRVRLNLILIRMVDHIDNKAISGSLLLTEAWIGVSLIFSAAIGVGATMVTSVYAFIAGVVLILVFACVLISVMAKRRDRNNEKKEEEKYEVTVK